MTEAPALPGSAPRVVGGRVARLRDPLVMLLVGGAATAYVGMVDPNQPGHYPTCPFLSLTGLFCPGCGALRAVHAMAQGEVMTALDRNVLVVGGAVLLAAIWIGRLVHAWRGTAPTRVAHPALVWGLLVLVVVFTVARNLPAGAVLAP